MTKLSFFSTLHLLLFSLFSLPLSVSGGFYQYSPRCILRQHGSTLWLTPDEERAAAMSNYFIRAHQEKLEAIKSVKDTTEQEIRDLMKEIEALRKSQAASSNTFPALSASISTTSGAGLTSLSKDALEEERAAAMSRYLIRAHQEKLDAIKSIKESKQHIIKELKMEINSLRKGQSASPRSLDSSSVPSTSMSTSDADLTKLSKEELITKIHQYQKFTHDYIVKSFEQKLQAVKAAEANTWEKFVARYPLALEAKSDSEEYTTAPTIETQTASESSLYQARSARVVAAASAGKSRWGNKEIEKVLAATEGSKNGVLSAGVQSAHTTAPTIVTQTASESSLYQARSARVVAAASAGKSRWGNKEIEKALAATEGSKNGVLSVGIHIPKFEISNGEKKPNSDTATQAVAESSLYQARSAKVAAAASAGKSRWGDKEIEKVLAATEGFNNGVLSAGIQIPKFEISNGVKKPDLNQFLSRVPMPPPPEVVAADHGLRANSGVGGLTLAERVALGFQAKSFTPSEPITTPVGATEMSSKETPSPLYQQRVARVLAAASAGKSRWGSKEIDRIQVSVV